MYTIAMPRAASRRIRAKSRSTSDPWRLLVGSSINSTRASRASARQISTICRAGSERSLSRLSGWISGCGNSSSSARARAHRRGTVDPPAMRHLVAEEDVVGDRQVRAERELLMDERDAAVARIAGRGGREPRAVEVHLAAIGLHLSGQHVHERALPRPVLAEQGQHLAGANGQIDPVERDRRAVALRDAVDLQSDRH